MQQAMPVIQASELYRSGGKVLKRLGVKKERLVIERDGYPVAVMVPYGDYEELMREQAARELRMFLDSIPPTDASEEEVEADVLKAVQEVRYGKRRKK